MELAASSLTPWRARIESTSHPWALLARRCHGPVGKSLTGMRQINATRIIPSIASIT